MIERGSGREVTVKERDSVRKGTVIEGAVIQRGK